MLAQKKKAEERNGQGAASGSKKSGSGSQDPFIKRPSQEASPPSGLAQSANKSSAARNVSAAQNKPSAAAAARSAGSINLSQPGSMPAPAAALPAGASKKDDGPNPWEIEPTAVPTLPGESNGNDDCVGSDGGKPLCRRRGEFRHTAGRDSWRRTIKADGQRPDKAISGGRDGRGDHPIGQAGGRGIDQASAGGFGTRRYWAPRNTWRSRRTCWRRIRRLSRGKIGRRWCCWIFSEPSTKRIPARRCRPAAWCRPAARCRNDGRIVIPALQAVYNPASDVTRNMPASANAPQTADMPV